MPRIQLKLAATLVALVAALVVLTGYFAERDLRDNVLRQIEGGLADEVRLVSELVGDRVFRFEDAPELTELARRASRAAGARVTLIAADGVVVADSEVDLERLPRLENHATRPEVMGAASGRITTATRLSVTAGRELFYCATPRRAGDPAGVVRLAVDLDDVEAAVGTLRGRLLLAGAMGLLGAVLLSFPLAGVLVRPLERIRETVVAIAGGSLSARVPWRSNDEFGEIADAVDRMGEELELRMHEVTSEKEQLRAVLTGMEEGVLMLDASRRIVLANRRVRELLGVRGDLEGATPLEVLRNVELEDALNAAFGAREPVRREIRVEGPRRMVLALRAVKLPKEVGAGVVAVLEDRTELRRLEVVRRDFVANASHELRTPLTAIRGFAETLVEGQVNEAERTKYLNIILGHAHRIGSLVDDLLELARIESGKLELGRQRLDLAAVVDKVLSHLEPLFAQRNLDAARGDLEVPPVLADPRALEQVLGNLLDNAAKYTEPGGRIRVRAESAGRFVRICVEDTGIGIPEADRSRIFERFYRVDKARSRELGGTGLGLSIVRHLVESMGGRIGVESTPGKGSTFHFTLPRDSTSA